MKNKRTLKECINFLEEHKQYLGLSDWKMLISEKGVTQENGWAEVEPEIYEKIFKVVISKELLTKSDDKIANVLFHELVHGRILVFQKISEEIIGYEEEKLANDITRGFERYKQFELGGNINDTKKEEAEPNPKTIKAREDNKTTRPDRK